MTAKGDRLGVWHTTSLYRADIWADGLKLQYNRRELSEVDRLLSIGLTRAYRTVPKARVVQIAGMICKVLGGAKGKWTCEELGVARHLIFECRDMEEYRRETEAKLKCRMVVDELVKIMLEIEESWKETSEIVERVIRRKL
ncbi:hypothetical protein HHI36_008076 [Cryptolaemus montrouzieri]|uniref:Uncharacterized protein n=1 Tax=Cryptolaemus montrouzieri TaxID=559131 RepID=A0ABD2MSB7_9CUCU